jgi:hypothetical protein
MKKLLLLLPLALAACDAGSTMPTEIAPPTALSLSVGNGPARYQMSSTTYTVNVSYLVQFQTYTYIHTYVLTTNPCNGTQTMTGSLVSNDGFQPSTTETVTFTIGAGGVINYHAVYDDPYYLQGNGFHYSYDATITGNTISPTNPDVVFVVTSSTSNYKNHGEYVSQSANKNDAAHSCIGMPIT